MAVNKKSKTKKSKNTSAPKGALDALFKKYGEEVINKGASIVSNISRISSGVLGIDWILGLNADGTGGAPEGRIMEIYGPESSGKTALTLYIIGQAQKAGKTCAFIDVEHALTEERCYALGVNFKELIVVTPECGEEALQISRELIDSGEVDFLGIDSVSALTPKSELEGEVGASQVGKQARMMGQALRQMCRSIAKNGVTAIFINQIRMKIGVMFGSPETTSGGEALKFYASVRLDVRKSTKIKIDDEIVGTEVKVKAVKNKTAPAWREKVFKFFYKDGFSIEDDLLDYAVKFGIIEKAGAWFSMGDEKIGQGALNAMGWLKEHPDQLAAIDRACREKLVEHMNPSLNEKDTDPSQEGEEAPQDEVQEKVEA